MDLQLDLSPDERRAYSYMDAEERAAYFDQLMERARRDLAHLLERLPRAALIDVGPPMLSSDLLEEITFIEEPEPTMESAAKPGALPPPVLAPTLMRAVAPAVKPVGSVAKAAAPKPAVAKPAVAKPAAAAAVALDQLAYLTVEERRILVEERRLRDAEEREWERRLARARAGRNPGRVGRAA
jgi:hypothetical protein